MIVIWPWIINRSSTDIRNLNPEGLFASTHINRYGIYIVLSSTTNVDISSNRHSFEGNFTTYFLSYPLYNIWSCVFSVYRFPLWWLREYTLCLIIIIKSEVWTIIHYLRLGREWYALHVFLDSYRVFQRHWAAKSVRNVHFKVQSHILEAHEFNAFGAPHSPSFT